jgi:thiosulfate dehydrogenase
MIQSFAKLITLVLALLSLAVSLVAMVGLLLFLSVSGVQLPSLFNGAQEAPAAEVEIPVVKALADPASLWKAPDFASIDQEPNAAELHYGKE